MRRAVLADTGPLYAAVDPDDDYHGRAMEEITRLNRTGQAVAVLYPTLLEAYSLVVYRLGTRSAHSWLKEISRNAQLLNPSAEDFQQAQERLLGYRDQQMSFFDATLATVSRRLKLPVWTYDHHFDVMAIDVWRE